MKITYCYSSSGYKDQIILLKNYLFEKDIEKKKLILKTLIAFAAEKNPFSNNFNVSPNVEFVGEADDFQTSGNISDYCFGNSTITFYTNSNNFETSLYTTQIVPIFYALGHEYAHFLQQYSKKTIIYKPILKNSFDGDLYRAPSKEAIKRILELELGNKIGQNEILLKTKSVYFNIYANQNIEIDARKFSSIFVKHVFENWKINSPNFLKNYLDSQNYDLQRYKEKNDSKFEHDLKITSVDAEFYKKVVKKRHLDELMFDR